MKTSRATKTFTTDQVIQALESKGIQYTVEGGRQINADLSGTGHHHIKITPSKGLYLDAATGKGGTISALLRQIHAEVPAGATAPAHPAKGGNGHGSTTADDAQLIWGAGWTCTHAKDMPADWDKGLNAGQKGRRRTKIEQQRDTVRAYLRARLGPDQVDHWSRQVRIGKNGLMLNPMQRAGVITGIQRTFFDQDGQKSERKMLGPQGTTFCPVPSGVNPRDLGVGAVKLAGEGWETIASTVQAAGWPGLACQFDGGVVKWATEQALQAKSMTADQLAQVPAAVFMADRDVSQAGQKASARAVKILRAAGLTAYYAIPPAPEHGGPKGGHKGSDWGDYPREGISSDVLAAHLALAIAHGDQEMPEVDEPGMVLPDTVQIRAWRPAQNPQAPAQSGPTHEVRANLQTALQQTVSSYLEWLKDKDKDTPFNPVLMMPTTGTGKSTAAKALTRHTGLRLESGRVCVFTPDHAQAEEYEHEGFFHFYGRNPEPMHCGYCPNHQTAQEAMDKGHISQAEVCKSCSNGFAWQICYYGEGEGQNAPSAADRVENSKHILASRGLDWRKVTPCVWQSHIRDALAAQFVVAASGSYSHSLTRDCLVIFDEHFEPGKGVNVTLQDIDHWTRRNQTIIQNLAKSVDLAVEKGRDDLEKLQAAVAAHLEAGEFFKSVALAMAGWVGKTGSISVDSTLLEAIRGILEVAKKSRKDDVALAAWEKLQFNAAGEMSDNPLRAAHAIAESLKYGDGFVSNGELVVAASLPVMERLASGQPTVIMDATPDPVIVDVVQAQGGQIVNAIAHQNVHIVRYPTRFWGLTPLNVKRSGADRRDREIVKYESLMKHHGEAAAFLFHKKAADELTEVVEADGQKYRARKDGGPVESLGYWGKHHRAHNKWKDKSPVIVGSFFPPLEAWRAEYQVSRIAALSAGANPDHWPAWPDDMEMVKDEWICEGGTDVQCRLPLPADTRIREWLLSRVTAETVQAIGRARGANAESTIHVHIYGGVPLHGLWQHGLTVAEYADDPECLGQTKAEHMEAMAGVRQDSLGRCDALAARVIAKGGTVTRQAMEDEVNAMLEEATSRADLSQGGYIYHSTLGQIESMPRKDTIQAWIAERMPVLSRHLSTKGRNGGLVKAAQAAAKKFGEEMLVEAMNLAESVMNAGFSADAMTDFAWQTVERNSPDSDIIAARLILEALGRTEKVPLPWDEIEEVQS
ncbi:hypothetical protein BBC27_08110 [Acidithiobacillus ferrivorans]|uniref:Toprim domain-containing protein n=1 Tax=Acidithiobacillus ferrivorans TaxID=160808 RepID=A0A1B9C0K3_9PROT|nr:toprim domain-containing protein [Acidithiobacillus ferrivorans]OCB03420.1 hypothetical protein BBC27_08110 [Acidithiobacillus ferrivorans]